MINTETIIVVIVVVLFIMIILFRYIDKEKFINIESFKNIGLGSKSGFGFSEGITNFPLFLNRYPKQLGSDFKLRSYIMKSKYIGQGSSHVERGLFTNGLGQINIGPSKIPVILIPGLGTVPIFAKWSIQNSPTIKTLDAYNTYETSTKWSCKEVQKDWIPIWLPDVEGLAEYCFLNNAKIINSEGSPENSEGVTTIIPHENDLSFLNGYMTDLINALESNGYVQGSTLFGLSYDFRKITNKQVFDDLLESFMSLVTNIGPCIIIGHDLGAVIANLLIRRLQLNFKKNYIKKFISISGAFGGCPKALRVFLSGESFDNSDIMKDTVNNYSGLHLMMPNTKIYNNAQLLNFKNVNYTSNDIPKLIMKTYGKDTLDLYNNSLSYQNESLKEPGVPTYILSGTNIMTESNYIYENSLSDDPQKKYPYFDITQGNQSNFEFNNLERIDHSFNGDGTMTDLSMKYPLSWSKLQKEPVFFKFYNEAEHLKILSMNDPIVDIINIISH